MRHFRGNMFKDPTKPKKKAVDDKPWDFRAPSYDNRTSCSISAGSDYGVGFKTPVGREKASGITSGPIPMQAKCFSPDEVMHEDEAG
jgi:hypothetical protein